MRLGLFCSSIDTSRFITSSDHRKMIPSVSGPKWPTIVFDQNTTKSSLAAALHMEVQVFQVYKFIYSYLGPKRPFQLMQSSQLNI